MKLWLWKNGDHYLAFDNAYPCHPGGDPITLGEPSAIAFLHPSINGNTTLAFDEPGSQEMPPR
jgi:hypothetical protein